MSRQGLPARRITIPEGYVLTSEEICRATEALNARVASGEPGFDVTKESPEWYSVKVPVGAALTKEEIIVALTRLNEAKEHGHADVTFTFADGQMVKRGWILLKDARTVAEWHPTQISLGGQRGRQEF